MAISTYFNLRIHFLIISIILSVYIYQFINEPINNTDILKCPFCFGTNYCDSIFNNNVILKTNSIVDIFNNYFSVKNVFVTKSGVVLKKLGYDDEFENLDKLICSDNDLNENCDFNNLNKNLEYKDKIYQFLRLQNKDSIQNFKLCNSNSDEKWLNYILQFKQEDISMNEFYKNIWTILQINIEPLILQLLKSENEWPVPKYFGSCGRLIAEEYSGKSLNDFKHSDWMDRAYLSLQLLEAAYNFTEKHPDFRFYLTDISSDNIAVSEGLRITFVDLENVIMVDKENTKHLLQHHSQIYDLKGFSYSEDDICSSSLSDHNYYSVCKLLLSRSAPWPMMQHGLLHSPPDDILSEYPDLFQLIEFCVKPIKDFNRFEVSRELIQLLRELLTDKDYFT